MKTNILLLLFALSFTTLLKSQTSLKVADPRNWGWWWEGNEGTIEEASMVLSPQGIYTNVDLYLTFSARGTQFESEYDTLEITLDFTLPEKAIVHDSWLWVGEDIIQAIIIDRPTATGIYEGIVDRRQDPSILYKNQEGNYQLRIFPMAGTDTRRVRLSYLVPTDWTQHGVTAALPMNIINASLNPLENLQILSPNSEDWSNPIIRELQDYPFVASTHPELGAMWETNLPTEALEESLSFEIQTNFEDGIYINQFQDDQNKVYQLALIPSQAFDLQEIDRKMIFAFDYQYLENGAVPQEEVLSDLKTTILTEFSDQDAFNLVFGGVEPSLYSEEWMPATEEMIEAVFEDIGPEPMPVYPNLDGVLHTALDFIQTNNNEGEIQLIANSDQFGSAGASGALEASLLSDMGDNIIPISIIDFQDRYFSIHQIGGATYNGNEYFYSNIATATGGRYECTDCELSIAENLALVFETFNDLYGSIDVQTSLAEGFCYSRYNLGTSGIFVDLNKPILQIGRFEGDFPFEIQVGGIIDGNIFSGDFEVAEEDIPQTDSLSVEAWGGNYIRELESLGSSSEIVDQIVEFSMAERVLSKYTAFLCLEPSLGGEPCEDCIDQTPTDIVITTSEELKVVVTTLNAAPNPFEALTRIQLQFGTNIDISTFEFVIFNTLGQLVYRFSQHQVGNSDELMLEWDGRDHSGNLLPAGVYHFIAQSPEGRFTLKLVKI